ncbi:MAG: cytochrome c peroxidase [Thiobacillaceae bacterium]
MFIHTSKISSRTRILIGALWVGMGLGLAATSSFALPRIPPDDLLLALKSLKDEPVPPVPGIEQFVRNKSAAIALGKALFWDMQAGSDGNACASCHFAAGADSRLKNQLSPGLNAGDVYFGTTPALSAWGPNHTLTAQDFPLHQLADPMDRNSAILFSTNDVVSSAGTFDGSFMQVIPRQGEACGTRSNDTFMVGGKLARKVEPRNTPTTINAAFNFRNFWDGRANNVFNGVNPFGERDLDARVLLANADGSTSWVRVALANSSLASQAVGPPLSNFEMSCANKSFKDIGRKLNSMRPLSQQDVHVQDSALSIYRYPTGKGLKYTYAQLIRMAFDPRWWNARQNVSGYAQIEHNFSLFWGLAIQLYEATLVSDDAPFDRFMGDANNAPDGTALTTAQQRGLAVFQSNGLCINCHNGAEFTGAATRLLRLSKTVGLVERMAMGSSRVDFSGGTAIYDSGFYNIGVRPTVEDRGVGGTDPFGHPLSIARQYLDKLRGFDVPDSFSVNSCLFEAPPSNCLAGPNPETERVAVDGSFKTPGLRNVSLTKPYFHNGSRFTLEQVVAFYNRGGDRRGSDGDNSTGYVGADAPGGATSNLVPDIQALKSTVEQNVLTQTGLTEQQKSDLVDFLRNGLTDKRVACEQAPFDHPSLRIPNGHVGDDLTVIDADGDGKADDAFLMLPAVGSGGLMPGQCLKLDDGSDVM